MTLVLLCSVLFVFVIPVNKKKILSLIRNGLKTFLGMFNSFGGGLAMASLVMDTGLANEISKNISFLNKFDVFLIILFLTFLTSFFTEFTSNTATTFLLYLYLVPLQLMLD